MIFITNPFTLLLLILLWSINAWLFMATVRLLIDKFSSNPSGKICQCLSEIVDPLPNRIDRWIFSGTKQRIPAWLTWVTTFVALIIVRHFLILFIISHHSIQ